MEETLLILGAGGHGFVVKEVAEACGYKKISFLDDNSPWAIGKIDDLSQFKEYKNVFVSIGLGEIRKSLIEKACELGFYIPTLIHPSAYVSPSATIGYGTIVEPKAIINSHVCVEIGCILSVGSVVDHNAHIGAYSQVNAGCIVKSEAKVDTYTKLEVGDIIYK